MLITCAASFSWAMPQSRYGSLIGGALVS